MMVILFADSGVVPVAYCFPSRVSGEADARSAVRVEDVMRIIPLIAALGM